MIETYRGMVYALELDHVGHMNVQWYVNKFDQASWQLLAKVGIPPSSLKTTGKGMAAVQQNIQYKCEALEGDLLEVRSQVRAVTNKTIRFAHVMTNSVTGAELATCEIVAAFIDLAKRKSEPLPDHIRRACEKAIEKTLPPG